MDVDLIHLLYKLGNGHELDYLKFYGVSFWHMLCDENYDFYKNYDVFNKYCSVEYRVPNGTLDPIIWQNNINFFVKLLLYCKNPNFNEDILNRRRMEVNGILGDITKYSDIYIEQAIELCDMIFDNNLDKIYFLRQYLKSYEISNKPFIKAKRFTVSC